MAAIWKGSLSFGLVNIPIELRSAIKSTEKISFRQLDRKHLKPIKYSRVSTVDDKEVDWKDIVKGFEISKGKFVIVEDEDFKSVHPEMSRVLEMTAFVPAESIDPRYFDTPYFMVPREGGDKAYALLRDALAEAEKIGIGTFALRQKQHLAAVKAVDNAMVLELMRFEAELVDPAKIKFPGSTASARPAERKMAVQLIESLSEDFDPSKYKDVYSDRLRAIIKAKAKGKTIEVEEPEPRENTKVVDLMARLQASLEAAKKGGSTHKAAKKSARKRKTA